MEKSNHKLGVLNIGKAGANGNGKLIDTWNFAFPFSQMLVRNFEREELKPFAGEVGAWEINVYMIKEAGKIRFAARCDRFADTWSDESLDAVRQMVEEKVKDQASILGGSVWEPWLEVKTRRSDRVYGKFALGERTLELSYDSIMKGRHPAFPGQEFQLGQYGQAFEFPKPKAMGVDESQPGGTLNAREYRTPRDIDTEYAYVPDTPENRQALEDILAAMDKLSSQLAHVLSNEVAADTLGRIHKKMTPALPGPG